MKLSQQFGLVAITGLFSILSVSASANTCGDVTKDGKVSSLDASRIQRVAAGLDQNSSDFSKLADVDSDGKITKKDSQIVQEFVVKTRKKLHCPAYPNPCGDITGDGRVSSLDASRLMQSAGKPIPPEMLKKGDVNLDGKITSEDANILQRYAVGLEKDLKCPASP